MPGQESKVIDGPLASVDHVGESSPKEKETNSDGGATSGIYKPSERGIPPIVR